MLEDVRVYVLVIYAVLEDVRVYVLMLYVLSFWSYSSVI